MSINTIRTMTYVCAGATIILNLGLLGFILVQNKINNKKKKNIVKKTEKTR